MFDNQRYERQMLLAGMGEQGQRALKNSKVLLVGVGGLGSPNALYLAGAGVGTLGLMDADVVSLSNLHRQILYRENEIGAWKVERAKEHLSHQNSEVTIHTYPYQLNVDNAREIIREYDFIIDAVDNFATRFLLNDACVLEGKPFCHAGIVGYYGQVMTYVPGMGPCYRCVFEQVPRGEDVPSCKVSGVLGPAVGVLGCVQALEAIKYLTGVGELLTGKMLTVDTLTMKTRMVPLGQSSPSCKVCGAKKEIVSLANNRAEYESDFCKK